MWSSSSSGEDIDSSSELLSPSVLTSLLGTGDGFIMLMHAVHAAQQAEEPLELPPPPPPPPDAEAPTGRRPAAAADDADGGDGGGADGDGADAAPLLSGDASAAYGEFLGWSHYVEYSEQLLLAAGGGNVEANPFEAEAALDEGLHVWIVADFSVVRLRGDERRPTFLRAEAYIALAPVAARTAAASPRGGRRGSPTACGTSSRR